MGRFKWARWSDERLLELRLCDLGVSWEGTWIQPLIERVEGELLELDLRVRPHFWVSDEWFSPEGVPGVAVPFFLTHPRLMRLERKQMLEVEGGTRASCLRLLRHELGHAADHAFELRKKRRRQQLFGRSSTPYPQHYRPNPASRRHVVHLPYWYAQAHPDEDFAETFAVWLTPRSGWRRRYAGWPALRKLEFVDELMGEIAGRRPPVRSRARVDEISRLKATLREYYAEKRERYQALTTNIYDQDLMRLFGADHSTDAELASAFLRRNRAAIRRLVARGTGKHELALDTVLADMISRCHELRLRAADAGDSLLVDFAILLAARSVEYVYRGRREWHAL